MSEQPQFLGDGSVKWPHVLYVAKPPVPGRCLILGSERTPTPALAREIAAELLVAADFADAQQAKR
jgi:hypothetical protein